MESQVENAIQIAWNPQSDPNLKQQAIEFVNQLRFEPQSWTVCLPIATRIPPPTEIVQHIAIDIVNGAIQSDEISPQELVSIKESLMQYVRRAYGSTNEPTTDTVNIQNKFVEGLTYLFTRLYPSEWTTFFDETLALTEAPLDGVTHQGAVIGTKIYLKITSSVHDEIADVLRPKSPEEKQRDNALKDLIRTRDVGKITASWLAILDRYDNKDISVIDLCLSAVGRWSSWIDLSLILQESFLNRVFGYVITGLSANTAEVIKLRDASLSTITEILSKKMRPSDKLDLIDLLRVSELVARLTSSTPLQDLRFTSSYDTDFAEEVAKLVNTVILDIIIILDNGLEDDTLRLRAHEYLKSFIPYLLRFFSDEYDEICSSVIPSLTDLLTLFRKRAQGNADYLATLPSILQAIMSKMKYDETSEWASDDSQTDEAEFQDLRKRLQILQQAVASVDESLYINTVTTLVANCFDSFSNNRAQVDWRDIDLVLYEMYLFGQLAVKNGNIYSKSKPVSPAAESLIAMMVKLVECNIASASHPAIHLQFMEICVRYSSFFEANPQLIPPVLENFVRFVHHTHPKVKQRSWYCLHRFIKHLRMHLGNIAQTVIQAVSDLLPIKAELPDEASDNEDMSSEENDQSAEARFTSQLYLYEAVGNICSTPAVPVDSQVLYVKTVTNPLFTDLEQHLGPASSGDARAVLQIHHLIMALGTLAHGFSEWMPSKSSNSRTPAKEVSDEFWGTSEAILVALEALNASLDIRTAARSAFSRLVGVLGSRILPQLPRWIEGLLTRASSKEEMTMFLRVLDHIVYEFKSEIFEILNTILTPFLRRVFEGIAEPITGTDDKVQLAELKDHYLAFLLVVLSNDLGHVFVTNENQPIFDSMISTLEHFTKDTSDLSNAKLSFTVLSKMASTWGGPDVVASDGSTISVAPQPILPGFDRFLMERFSPLVWALPGNTEFNPKDAQAKQVLGEAGGLQVSIYMKTGQLYASYLETTELRNVGLDANGVNEYIGSLKSSDSKRFRRYFQNLVQKSR